MLCLFKRKIYSLLLAALLGAGLAGCAEKKANTETETAVVAKDSLSFGDCLSLELDTNTAQYSLMNQFVALPECPAAVVSFQGNSYTLQIHDLTSGKLLKAKQYEKIGAASVGKDIQHIYFHNSDSIFFLSDVNP